MAIEISSKGTSKTNLKATPLIQSTAQSNNFLELQQLFKSQLGSSFKKFSLSSTPVIVTGYQGLPLLEAAQYLAKQKLCPQGCLTCAICESIDKGSSYQVKIIKPDGRAVKVDQIRDVIDTLAFKRDQPIVVIVDQAHLMNAQASNALLKTLEEPPENCWIILTSPSIRNLLSTIRSRCLVYKLKPLDFAQLNSFKNHQGLQTLQSRWDWIQNSEEILNNISETKVWFHSLKENSNEDFLDWMKGREGLAELITYLRLILKSEVQDFSSSSWVKLVDKIQELEVALQANVDAKLVEDHLLLALKEFYAFH